MKPWGQRQEDPWGLLAPGSVRDCLKGIKSILLDRVAQCPLASAEAFIAHLSAHLCTPFICIHARKRN